jgi:ribonuclease-3
MGRSKKEAEQNAAHDALKKGNYDFKEIIWWVWFFNWKNIT